MIYLALLLALATSALCDQRIIGGEDVLLSRFAPWQASLQVSGTHYCGGSLISETKVMSACQCKRDSLDVVLGTIHHTAPEQKYFTKDFKCHPFYNEPTFDYDFAIITIPKAVLSDTVTPITVADQEYNPGTQALMTGWGWNDAGLNSITLQYKYTNLMCNEDCQIYWGSRVNNRMLCAFDITSTTCNGDFGGPLAVNDGGTWVLIGNASWGSSGCNVLHPAVWSKNFYVRSWIRANALV